MSKYVVLNPRDAPPKWPRDDSSAYRAWFWWSLAALWGGAAFDEFVDVPDHAYIAQGCHG